MYRVDIFLRNIYSFDDFSRAVPLPSSLYLSGHNILKRLALILLKLIKVLLYNSHLLINFLDWFRSLNIEALLPLLIFYLVLFDIAGVEVIFQEHGSCDTFNDYLIYKSFSFQNSLRYLFFVINVFSFVLRFQIMVSRS